MLLRKAARSAVPARRRLITHRAAGQRPIGIVVIGLLRLGVRVIVVVTAAEGARRAAIQVPRRWVALLVQVAFSLVGFRSAQVNAALEHLAFTLVWAWVEAGVGIRWRV